MRGLESRGWLIADWVGFACCSLGVILKLVAGLPPNWLTVGAALAGFYLAERLVAHYRARAALRQAPRIAVKK